MTGHSCSAEPVISRRHGYLLLASALTTYLLIVMGGVVCVTGSGGGCPDWPGCYGSVIPPLQTASLIEFLHRLVAGLAFILIIGAAFVSWRKTGAIVWVRWPAVLAAGLVLVVSGFGAAAVLRGLPRGLAAVDLGLALIVLALVWTATVAAYAQRANPSLEARILERRPVCTPDFLDTGCNLLCSGGWHPCRGRGLSDSLFGVANVARADGGLAGLAPNAASPARRSGRPLDHRYGRAGLAYSAPKQGHCGCWDCCGSLVPGRNGARRVDAGSQCDDFHVGRLRSDSSRAVDYDGGSSSAGQVGILTLRLFLLRPA